MTVDTVVTLCGQDDAGHLRRQKRWLAGLWSRSLP